MYSEEEQTLTTTSEESDVAIFIDSLTQTNVVALLEDKDAEDSSFPINPIDKEREEKRLKFSADVEDNLIEDYENSRKTLHTLLKKSSHVFEAQVKEAVVSGDPKQVSALASLMNSINSTTKNLIDLSEKVSVAAATAALADIDTKHPVKGDKAPSKLPVASTTTTNIQNNININSGEISSGLTTEQILRNLANNSK